MLQHSGRIVACMLAVLLVIPSLVLAQTAADRQAIIIDQLEALRVSSAKIQGKTHLDRQAELAVLEAKAGRMDRAQQIAQTLSLIVNSTPNAEDDTAILALARAQAALGQWDAATATLSKAKQAYRLEPAHHQLLTAMVEAGQFKAARDKARVLIPSTMNRAKAYQLMLISHAQRGHFDEVMTFLDSTFDLTSAFSKQHGYVALAQVFVEQNQLAKARQLMQDIYTQSRGESVATTRISLAGDLIEGFAVVNDLQTARVMLQQAEQDLAGLTDARDSFSYNRCLAALVIGWARLGDLDKAMSFYNQMNKPSEQNNANVAIVKAMFRAGRMEQAQQFGKEDNRVRDNELLIQEIAVRLEKRDFTGAIMRARQMNQYDFSRSSVLRSVASSLAQAGQIQTLEDLIANMRSDDAVDSVRLGLIEGLLMNR